jgi:hypothetical protein
MKRIGNSERKKSGAGSGRLFFYIFTFPQKAKALAIPAAFVSLITPELQLLHNLVHCFIEPYGEAYCYIIAQ